MSGADLLIGVDGGRTKTQAVAADLQGNVLARGLAGASNHKRVGLEKACAAIAAACFGPSGIDRPEDEAALSSWARSQGFAVAMVSQPYRGALTLAERMLAAASAR